jgi:methanethiol S-methyltransferase
MSTYDTAFRLGVTAGLWLAWCVVHSVLATESLIRKSGVFDSSIGPYYRLIYSLFAVLTLILVSILTPRVDEITLWTWEGGLRLLQTVLWLVALTVAWLSFRMIGIGNLLGLCALGICKKDASQPDVLITWGIYGVLRHPQFAAGLVLLWSRDLTDTGLVINVVLSSYLIVGAHIEESRLLAKYGEEYRKYKAAVPGFVPNAWPNLILVRF